MLCLGGCGWYAARQFANIQTAADEGSTKGSLSSLRSALQGYYGDHEGKFPTDLAILVPKYLKYMPMTITASHGRVRGDIFYLSGKDFREGRFTDTGGWAYVNTPGDPEFGTLVVNCTHNDYSIHPEVRKPWTTF